MGNDLTRYFSKRDAIQTGDPIQFQSNTLIGKPIQWRTGSKYNHTAIAIRIKEFDEERVYLLEALGSGTVLNPLSARLREHRGHAWVLPLKADHGPLRRSVGQWALRHVGIRYDYFGVLKQLLCRVSSNARRLFCSEYWWMAFRDAARKTENGRKSLIEARKTLKGKAPQPADIPNLGLTQSEIQIL